MTLYNNVHHVDSDRSMTGDCMNLYDFGARLYLPALGLFDRPDPIAINYPSLNPYLYCAANPVMNVDPTGKDTWRINAKGEVVEWIDTKEYDRFEFIDDDGNILVNSDGEEQRLQFKYGTISRYRTMEYSSFTRSNGTKQDAGSADVFEVRGDNEATVFFEMFAQNVTGRSYNEVSHIKTGLAGDKGLNFISCGHVIGSEPGMSRLYNTQLINGFNIREMIHSHPLADYAGKGDKKFKTDIVKNCLIDKIPIPVFSIYHVPSGTYIKF